MHQTCGPETRKRCHAPLRGERREDLDRIPVLFIDLKRWLRRLLARGRYVSMPSAERCERVGNASIDHNRVCIDACPVPCRVDQFFSPAPDAPAMNA